jgi:hypothetical protein
MGDDEGGRGGATILDGQTLTSVGYERAWGNLCIAYAREYLGLDHVAPLTEPHITDDYMHGRAGTPNHRFLGRSARYLWALRTGSHSQLAEARESLCAFMEAEHDREGLGWAETLTTSHDHTWRIPMAAVRCGALKYNDTLFLDLTGKRYRCEMYLRNLMTRRGHWFSPGSRPAGSTHDGRTVWGSIIAGEPAPNRLPPLTGSRRMFVDTGKPIAGRPNDTDGPFWSLPYNAGVWLTRELIRRGDDLGGAASGRTEEPKLLSPLHLYTRGDDWVFAFPHLRKASHPLWWTASISGELIDAPAGAGKVADADCPFDWPEIPGAKLTVIPGVKP